MLATRAHLLVLVVKDGRARLNLGIKGVRVVDAHEKLEVRLHRNFC